MKFVGDSLGLGTTATNHVAVDNDKNAHFESHGNDPAGTDRALRMSEQGSTVIDGVYHAANNSDPSQSGLVGMFRNAAPSDADQTLRITGKANAAGDVRALDVAIRDENGEPYTATNPMPVTLEESEGNEVHDQDTAVDLASLAVDDHNLVVAASTTFILHQVVADASGDARYELLIGDGTTPTEVFTRKAMTYSSNSKRGDIEFKKGLVVTAAANPRTVRVQRKNLDNKVQDVHTTIVGVTLV
jgi:hypothetical protein